MHSQFTGHFGIDLGRQGRVAFAGIQICQRCAVDHPIRVGFFEQALDDPFLQQVCGQHFERCVPQPQGVHQPNYGVVVPRLQSNVDPKQAAGSGDKYAHDHFSSSPGAGLAPASKYPNERCYAIFLAAACNALQAAAPPAFAAARAAQPTICSKGATISWIWPSLSHSGFLSLL